MTYDTFHLELLPDSEEIVWRGVKDPVKNVVVAFCPKCGGFLRRGRATENENTMALVCRKCKWEVDLRRFDLYDFGFADDGVCGCGCGDNTKEALLYRMAERDRGRAWAGRYPAWGDYLVERELAKKIESERRAEGFHKGFQIMTAQDEDGVKWDVGIESAVPTISGTFWFATFSSKEKALFFVKKFAEGMEDASDHLNFKLVVRAHSKLEFNYTQADMAEERHGKE